MTEDVQSKSLAPGSYQVVVNDEEQYSIWLVDRDIPAGWHALPVAGTKDECLSYIESTWTDITPLSVRRARKTEGR